jgi:PAS domain S-box-containing protein
MADRLSALDREKLCAGTSEPARPTPPASAAEQQFRTIVDSVPGLVAILNVSGEIELVNRGVLEYFGRSLEELQDWTTGDSVHPDDLPAVIALWQRAIRTGQLLESEHRLRRSDGVYRWFQLRGLPRRDDDHKLERWYCLMTDIHDRKQIEKELRRSEAFLREAQRLSHMGSWRFDVARGVVEASPQILEAHRLAPDQDVSEPASWFERIHAEDRPRVVEAYTRSERERTEYRADYRVVRSDGTIGYLSSAGRPILDESGQLVEFIGASLDITEHWQAKTELLRASEALHDLQEKLARAARITTVGELAAAIAHEVNQPLAAVVANGHACLRWLAASPPNIEKAIEAGERIVRDGKEAAEVVRRIRSLFKRGTAEKVAINLNDVISQMLRLVDAERSRAGVTLQTELAPGLPPVLGDRVQLELLALNLLRNGLDAMAGSERPKTLFVRSLRTGDGSAQIEIRDSGVGLPHPDKIFEPFFTTKENGLGMGLAICRSIAEAHDGRLWATACQPSGTTFWLTLPLEART